MKVKQINMIEKELNHAAFMQDQYDLKTINLIAPASPTPMKYFFNTKLRHNDIAEGLLNSRPYAGAEWFNKIEQIAVDMACAVFEADHANVQPHSVSQANQAVYQALLQNGDTVLAMKFSDGGHLTHGLKINFSGRFYNFQFYGIDENGLIDYKGLEAQAVELKPKMIVCGASSYPRKIDFKRLAGIAKKVGAYLVADLSHPAGLIVGGKFPKPFPHCDVVTLTLDKTMLGPHGGIILCKHDLAERIDKGVHPGAQSSIPLRRIFEMANCLIDVAKPWFIKFIDRLMVNMKAFEGEFSKHKGLMVTGGTDTHLLVLNTLDTFGLTGKESETLLEELGILTNRQVIPGETQKPYVASGIRLGATWLTARGYSSSEIRTVAKIIVENLGNPNNPKIKESSIATIKKLLYKKRKLDVWQEELIVE